MRAGARRLASDPSVRRQPSRPRLCVPVLRPRPHASTRLLFARSFCLRCPSACCFFALLPSFLPCVRPPAAHPRPPPALPALSNNDWSLAGLLAAAGRGGGGAAARFSLPPLTCRSSPLLLELNSTKPAAPFCRCKRPRRAPHRTGHRELLLVMAARPAAGQQNQKIREYKGQGHRLPTGAREAHCAGERAARSSKGGAPTWAQDASGCCKGGAGDVLLHHSRDRRVGVPLYCGLARCISCSAGCRPGF